jgi:hypothetical protein
VQEVLYVVTERSAVGETVLGVFSSLEKARQVVPPASSGRLEDYRIEGHVLDQPPEPRTPWRVRLSRDGSVYGAEVAVVCACADAERQLAESSFTEPGGLHMQVIVRAASPGQAIAAAQNYRAWLLAHQNWSTQATRLDVIEADPSATAPPVASPSR